MHQVPNWFRWLLIFVATLILCACRAPLQEGQPLLPLIVPNQFVTSSPDTVSLSNAQAVEQETDIVSHRKTLLNTLERIRSNNAPLPSEPLRQAASQDLAPVVRQTTKGVELQQIEAILTDSANDLSSPAASRPTSVLSAKLDEAAENAAQSVTQEAAQSHAPVYLRLNDDSAVVEPRVAQLESVGDVKSPFLDDPAAPVLDVPTPAPVEAEGQLRSDHQQEVIVEEPIISDDATIGVPNEWVIQSPVPFEHPAYEEIPAHEYLIQEYPITEYPITEYPIHEHAITEYPLPECPIEVVAEDPACELNVPPEELVRLYPGEYICDGGDAAGAVAVRNDWSLRNLDPEDTVGHYDTLDHRVLVEASNRICIYAPRFAAARKVTAPFQNEKQEQAMVAGRQTQAVVDSKRQESDSYSQTVSTQRHVLLQPASSLKARQPGVEGIHRQAMHVLDHDLSLHENLRVIKFGVHKQSEKAQLAEFSAKAVAWSHDKSVQVVVDEVVAQTRVSRRGTDTIFAIGDNGPAKLRVIKTASKADALPGEEIEFTLRFDNVGFQPIGNVTIIDNLTTRLELIEESDLCSMDCQFFHDGNEVESLTLRWEINDPIEPGQGGLIRFRCRVR